MKREEFERRFFEVLGKATESSGEFASRAFPAPLRGKLYGAGGGGQFYPIEQILERLYLGTDLNYVFIDVGVIADGPDAGSAWIAASGHEPRPDAGVWDANGTGPFKHLVWALPAGSKFRAHDREPT